MTNGAANAVATSQPASATIDLSVQLGRLRLANPILTASGTFGYVREMQRWVDLSKLGGVLPKTITAAGRAGNAPWRTVETTAGLLNAIGLDNDGIDYFCEHHWPYLQTVPTAVVVSIAGKSHDEFIDLARRLDELQGLAAIELNISCPNVSGGVDFGTDPQACYRVVTGVRQATRHPIIAKLTPNVTSIVSIAQAAADAGADAVSAINTVLGMAIDWRRARPLLGNRVGGLSGPAIKPIALRCVYQIAAAVRIPIIGIGGISTIDDVMEFLVAGASAVQIGTANYYRPTISEQLVQELPTAIADANAASVAEVIGRIHGPR